MIATRAENAWLPAENAGWRPVSQGVHKLLLLHEYVMAKTVITH